MTPDQFIPHEQIRQVLDVSRILAVTTELDPLLGKIAEAAANLLGCERASIFLHDAKSDTLWTKVALQSNQEIRLPASNGIVGLAFGGNRLVDEPAPYGNERFWRGVDEATGFVTRNLLAAPMVDIENEPIGVIQAVNKKSGAFSSEDRAAIQLLASQAGVAIQRYRLQSLASETVRLQHEMRLARQIQDRMIPRHLPAIPGIKVAGHMIAASITGGDSYDLWKTSDGRLGIFLADACGHGVPAALVVSQARAVIRALSETELDPHKLLAATNRRLAGDLGAGMFVTVFLGFLETSGWLTWSSAGHGPILIKEGPDMAFRSARAPLPPLAVERKIENVEPERVRIGSGGMLAVISDGIFESFNPSGEQFGAERVSGLLEAGMGKQPGWTIGGIYEAVKKWEGGREVRDDQTVVVAAVGEELED